MPHAYKQSTLREVKNVLQHKLLPVFANSALKDISAPTLQCYISSLGSKGLSAKYIANIISAMRAMWKTAIAWKYVSHEPFEGLVLPRLTRPNSRVYTLEETKMLFDAADDKLKTFIWIAGDTGLRPGEICGLDWRNIDLKNGVIHVCQSAWRGQIVSPKTEAGYRAVSVSGALAERLRKEAKPEGLVFAYYNGRPWREEKVRERWINPLLDKLNIPRKGLSAFRHFNATEMDRRNVPVKTRQTRLGHSDPRITLGMKNRNGYTHMVSEDEHRVAEEFGSMFSLVLRPSCVQNTSAEAAV